MVSSFLTQPAPEGTTQIEELDRVRLLGETLAEGFLLPEGAKGTVVLKHGKGEAFEVEFTEPFHAVVGVPAASLQLTD